MYVNKDHFNLLDYNGDCGVKSHPSTLSNHYLVIVKIKISSHVKNKTKWLINPSSILES